ncbi:hypothetical protein CKO31_00145 [Thiohalocapsa halophila]|uniref:Uncharacterized protein n=1 Tax=Thiohalocapsa halophila TaxID=69359 RepID=A0ABS1CB43_9GAMM|nr:hypothetical protein [Thiohalocapsa halophila]MBK1629165.1 hypothetical protein [Thiohalocapsa halophila]
MTKEEVREPSTRTEGTTFRSLADVGLDRHRQGIKKEPEERREQEEEGRERRTTSAEAEREFKRELQRVARIVQELPYDAVFSITMKFLIAFWMANLVIVAIVSGVLFLLTGGLPGLSGGA